MAELKNTFTGGKMDKDTDERILQNGLYREALNISVSTSEDSDVGAAQNILGNIQVTDAISGYGSNKTTHHGKNYHVAAVVDPKTNMLYRLIHTPSDIRGVWMDRIIEFDTSIPPEKPSLLKEKAVFIDIFKVKSKILSLSDVCDDGNSHLNEIKLHSNKNLGQVRWGMRVIFPFNTEATNLNATVEHVNYASGEIIINKNLNGYSDVIGKDVIFVGDRNLNFGTFNPSKENDGLRKITGLNVIDGMLFWTDDFSEPKKINIERGKHGSDLSRHDIYNGLYTQPGTFDNFNHHTVLIVNEDVKYEKIYDSSACAKVGCTDPTAYNYDPLATTDDQTCEPIIWGCTDPTSPNFDPLLQANSDDGSCCKTEGCVNSDYSNYNRFIDPVCGCADDNCCEGILGCTDPDASNFDAAAEVDDGSCFYDIEDCTDSNAFNYNPLATTSCASCCVDIIYGCMDCGTIWENANPGFSCPEVYDEFGVLVPLGPGANNYNPDANTVDREDPCVYDVSGCTDPTALNYAPLATVPCSGCCIDVISGCTDNTAFNYDPTANVDDGSCEPFIYGCTDPTATNYNSSYPANTDDGSCEYPAIPGCTDPSALNYNATAQVDDGSCLYCGLPNLDTSIDAVIVQGILSVANVTPMCTSASLFNQGPTTFEWIHPDNSVIPASQITATTATSSQISLFDTATNAFLGNGTYTVIITEDCGGSHSCPTQATFAIEGGCMDSTSPTVLNYDPNANVHVQAMCEYSVPGCTDINSPNYDPAATVDDGSCGETVLGCIDGLADNYGGYGNPNNISPPATVDDGSCVYTGCGDPLAINYNRNCAGVPIPYATYDGGCCIKRKGCTDPNACNYDPTPGLIHHLPLCIYPGCMDTAACNYDPLATCDTGVTCTMPDGCTDPNATNYDPLALCDDGSCEYKVRRDGCTADTFGTIPAAINFDPTATVDDGSCKWEGCTDPTASNYDFFGTNPQVTGNNQTFVWTVNNQVGIAIDNGSCILPVYGCTDPTSLTYDPLATVDDNSCTYPPAVPGCMYGVGTGGNIYGPDWFANPYWSATYPVQTPNLSDPGYPSTYEACNYNPLATQDDGSCHWDPPIITVISQTQPTTTTSGQIEIQVTNPGFVGNMTWEWDDMSIPGSAQQSGTVINGGTVLITNILTGGYIFRVTTSGGGCKAFEEYEFTIPTQPLWGCLDPTANNYDPTATNNCALGPAPSGANVSSSGCPCTYDPAPIYGCMDDGDISVTNSVNFQVNNPSTMTNQQWWVNEGYPLNPQPAGGAQPGVLYGSDYPGVSAVNFSSIATVDDNSCVYEGCTDITANNYSGPWASSDDGSCDYCSGTYGMHITTNSVADATGNFSAGGNSDGNFSVTGTLAAGDYYYMTYDYTPFGVGSVTVTHTTAVSPQIITPGSNLQLLDASNIPGGTYSNFTIYVGQSITTSGGTVTIDNPCIETSSISQVIEITGCNQANFCNFDQYATLSDFSCHQVGDTYTNTINACDSYTWPTADGGNGQTYTTSGTLTNSVAQAFPAFSCIDTYNVNLTIGVSSSNSSTVSACDSYTWPINGSTYNTVGTNTYQHTITNPSGCPHVETLELTISPGGCTDPNACNYDPNIVAACDRGCTYCDWDKMDDGVIIENTNNTNNKFGWDVDISRDGNRVIVTDPWDTTQSSAPFYNAGAFHVYDYDNSSSSWGVQNTAAGLNTLSGGQNHYTGYSVALAGEKGQYFVVPSTDSDVGSHSSGVISTAVVDSSSVALYPSGSSFPQITLPASAAGTSPDQERGGSDVASVVKDDYIYLGAGSPGYSNSTSGASVPGNKEGLTRTYKSQISTNGSWTQFGGDILGGASNDESGTSVSMIENSGVLYLAVGSPGHTDASGNLDRGVVRVYQFTIASSSSWSQLGSDIEIPTLSNSLNTTEANSFGANLKLGHDGTLLNIVISGSVYSHSSNLYMVSYEYDSGWSLKGTPIEFQESSSTPYHDILSQPKTYTTGDSAPLYRHKTYTPSVTANAKGDRIAIGLNAEQEAVLGEVGAVHIYDWKEKSPGVKDWVAKCGTIYGNQAKSHFGSSIALSADGKRLVVGEPLYQDQTAGAGKQGRVKIYEVSDCV